MLEKSYGELEAIDMGKDLSDYQQTQELDFATIDHVNMWFIYLHECNGCSPLLHYVRPCQIYEIGKEISAEHYNAEQKKAKNKK